MKLILAFIFESAESSTCIIDVDDLSSCGESLTVVAGELFPDYAGTYSYMGIFNDVPYYKQDKQDSSVYIYRNTKDGNVGNENWHFFRRLGMEYADLYAPKSDCVGETLEWNAVIDGAWAPADGFAVHCNCDSGKNLFIKFNSELYEELILYK